MSLSSIPAPNFSVSSAASAAASRALPSGNIAPDYRGGYAGEATFAGGGGFDANAAASSAMSRALPSGTIAPDYRGGYAGEATFAGGGGFDTNALTVKASLAGKDIKNPSFVNPLANLVAINSTQISQSILAAQGKIPSPGDLLAKLNLNDKINQLSGGVGSALNGLTGSLPSLGGLNIGNAINAAGNISGAVNSISGAAGNFLGGAQSALGGIASSVQNAVGGISSVGGALSSLQSVAGSTSNIAADISGALNKLGGGNIAGGLMNSLGAVSAAAGMLNNFLSVVRGVNLPAGGELFAKNQSTLQLNAADANDWRVRINCDWKLFNSQLFALLAETGGVVWPFTPAVNISTRANYTQIDATHSNYTFQAYKNSAVDDITITGQFSCETQKDAAYWIAATVFFKTATKMFFGQGDNLGNPPIICNLSGYGSSVFEKVPVVVKSFSVDLPQDVNYIQCNSFGTSTWVPVISTISVTVSPIYNRRNLRKFSLQKFANGTLTESNGVGYI